jgi:hypothetical protein
MREHVATGAGWPVTLAAVVLVSLDVTRDEP